LKGRTDRNQADEAFVKEFEANKATFMERRDVLVKRLEVMQARLEKYEQEKLDNAKRMDEIKSQKENARQKI
jgi:hypothetical protein